MEISDYVGRLTDQDGGDNHSKDSNGDGKEALEYRFWADVVLVHYHEDDVEGDGVPGERFELAIKANRGI